jgi:aerobic carbon-monoxide dehydrogenase large subunit
MDARAFGKSIRRKEDARLLTGRGKYAVDFRLSGMVQAAVLRSPHPAPRPDSRIGAGLDGLTA